MPRLLATVQVFGNPLRRAYVEHIVFGVGTNMYMTDDSGRIRDENNNLGVDSLTNNADIRILCQNSVVKVLDGKFPLSPLPIAVNHDFTINNNTIININTTAEQVDHFRILNRCLAHYERVFRQFRPFSDSANPDFPLGRGSSLRSTKDQQRRIEVSYPSQFPIATRAFTEPNSAGTGFPLIQIQDRSRDNGVFGENGEPATVIPAELAHGLHFSLFSHIKRAQIETGYLGWIMSDAASGVPEGGTHHIGKSSDPLVAYLEALDHFSHRFSEFVGQLVPGGGSVPITAQNRNAFLAREIGNGGTTPLIAPQIATSGAGGVLIPSGTLTGPHDEGSVYGCIFVDFARRVGLRTAVNAYLRSALAGATSVGEYRNWIATNRPEHLVALDAARATWGL